MEKYESKRGYPKKTVLLIILVLVFAAGYLAGMLYPYQSGETDDVVMTTAEPTVEPELPFDSEVESVDAADSYFEDAVFIGNSRMEGLVTNVSIGDIRAITSVGMTVESAKDEKLVRDGDEKITVIGKLEKDNYKKVYLMLGTNELGWVHPETFIDEYSSLIDEIRAVNPDALVYVFSIMPVNEGLVQNPEYQNNSHISTVNAMIKKMCDEKEIYYLNVYDFLYDEESGLEVRASTDGVHLGPLYCNRVFDYLKNHYVEVD